MTEQPRPAPDVVLASLAIIRANFDYGGRSYLDNFVPFALDAVANDLQRDHNDADAARAIRDRFGLNIPTRVVESILSRAVRQGLGTWKDRRFSLTDQGTEGLSNIGPQQAAFMRQQAALAQGLVRFADSIGVVLTPESAEEALLGYVQEQAVPLLTHAVRGGTYAHASSPVSEDRAFSYVVSAYVAHVASADPAAFDQLESMVKGSMLASALYLPTVGELDRKFSRTTLYLDTPILIKALGHDGGESRAAVLEVILLARAQGAEVACLEHNLTEVRAVMEGGIAVVRRNGIDERLRPIDRWFLDCEYTESDIRLLIERLPDDLQAHKIGIHRKPDHVERLTVDEAALEVVLQSRVRYRRRPTLLTDLDSITSVHRKRNGESPPRLEDCRAVFVTDNGNLAAAAREFFGRGRHAWPLVMLDHDLAAILWVKAPTAAPDLPRRQIIADCLAALQPSPQLWQRYVEVIEQLKTRDEFNDGDLALLRYSGEVSRTLMDLTQGEVAAVSPATIEAVLGAAKNAAAAPALALVAKAETRLADATSTAEGLREENSRQSDLSSALAVQVSELKAREIAQRTRAQARADIQALRIRNGVLIALSLVISCGAAAKGYGLGGRGTTRAGICLGIIVAFGAALGLLRAVIGGSVREWSAPLVKRLSAHLEQRALRDLGL